MRSNQVMFVYKSQLKNVKSRKETTLLISARNTNSRKIAANTVFAILGNSDVQRGLLKIRVIACGSECRRFESVRAPSKIPVGQALTGIFNIRSVC
jgi:hypothetical protein